MALTQDYGTVHRFTQEEVMRMVEAGVFEDPRPLELLDGVLIEVSEGTKHADVIDGLNFWLARGFADGRYGVRIGHPLAVPDPYSLPQPDLAVVPPGSYRHAHPSSALLAIEVSVTSLRTDLRVKTAKYARAGIDEYWVVDVEGKRLHVFTEPTADGYARHDERTAAGTITPHAFEVEPLALAELFAD